MEIPGADRTRRVVFTRGADRATERIRLSAAELGKFRQREYFGNCAARRQARFRRAGERDWPRRHLGFKGSETKLTMKLQNKVAGVHGGTKRRCHVAAGGRVRQ